MALQLMNDAAYFLTEYGELIFQALGTVGQGLLEAEWADLREKLAPFRRTKFRTNKKILRS